MTDSPPARQVGWYTSGVPAGNFALNIGYAEYPAMRARLLLGTARAAGESAIMRPSFSTECAQRYTRS
jgi:hypothetical protein